MEIIYNTNENKSNFAYCSELFKNKKVLNGFNKLNEELICEPICNNSYNCQNILFEREITADLFLCYPFKVVVKETIKFKSLYELISEIRKTYHKIYHKEAMSLRKAKKNSSNIQFFGIWGHGIYDLCIESIKIIEGDKNPLIDVSIGS